MTADRLKAFLTTHLENNTKPEAYIAKLVGDPGYKLRVGDHRLIMDIDNNDLLILIIKVGHRKNIYK